MAQVKNVKLSLTTSGENVTAKVGYGLTFLESEIGKSFKIVIELLGVDSAPYEDGTVTFILPGSEPPVLHTMAFRARFGPITYYNAYQIINVTSAELERSVVNTIKRETLDEDPGFTTHTWIDPRTGRRRTIQLPQRDEIQARVVLIPLGTNIGTSDVQNL